jgi:hypothetical protein
VEAQQAITVVRSESLYVYLRNNGLEMMRTAAKASEDGELPL